MLYFIMSIIKVLDKFELDYEKELHRMGNIAFVVCVYFVVVVVVISFNLSFSSLI